MSTLRKRTAELLEAHRPEDPAGKFVDYFLVILIIASIVAIILETVPGLGGLYGSYFFGFETFCVAVFTVEYLARLWSCVEIPMAEYPGKRRSRIRWMLSPLGIVDLLAILPFYIYLFIPETAESLLMLRIFRGMRLLRVFKLARYSPALNILVSVLRKEGAVLGVATSMLFVMLIVASWGIYQLERDYQADVFSSIPAAMWWAVVTLTTVGYGDVVPVTNGGRLFAGFISLLGIGFLALPAAIMASGFYREVHRRGETYRRAVEMALKDGKLSEFEAGKLEQLREELGINPEEALNTKLQVRHDKLATTTCPHCGKPI